MTAQPLEQQTYLPAEHKQVAKVLDFIKALESRQGRLSNPRYFLAGNGDNGRVELPDTVCDVVLQVLAAMDAGKAVSVVPQNHMLTTQQAADLLGVSRPTVIKLIDTGELAAETPGTKRRLLKLEDVVACKARRRDAQLRAIFETSDDYELDDDPELALNELHLIRKEVAARRRKRAESH